MFGKRFPTFSGLVLIKLFVLTFKKDMIVIILSIHPCSHLCVMKWVIKGCVTQYHLYSGKAKKEIIVLLTSVGKVMLCKSKSRQPQIWDSCFNKYYVAPYVWGELIEVYIGVHDIWNLQHFSTYTHNLFGYNIHLI